MSVNTAQLSHIKKSVLGPQAFDSFIFGMDPRGARVQLLPFCPSILERERPACHGSHVKSASMGSKG